MNEEIERAKMIIDYYENGEMPLTLKARIKLMKNYWRYRNANNKHNTAKTITSTTSNILTPFLLFSGSISTPFSIIMIA